MQLWAQKKTPVIVDWQFVRSETVAFPQRWIALLEQAHTLSGNDLTILDHEFGSFVGNIVRDFCLKFDLDPEIVAWHGHTVFHDPAKKSTTQIGHGGSLAAIAEKPVICQFRDMDLALGGQGAPLAPLADDLLLEQADFYINLGGISNISFKQGKSWHSFDVCPCNQLLNQLAGELDLPYDPEGSLAAVGQLNKRLFDQLNQWQYYQLKHPKSLDNNQIRSQLWPFINSMDDDVNNKLHTTCHHIAYQISKVIIDHSRDERVKIIFTGGGAHNHFLLRVIKTYLSQTSHEIISVSQELIDFKEAALMGLMGFLFMNGIPNIYSSVTGSRSDHVGGCLYQNWKSPADISL